MAAKARPNHRKESTLLLSYRHSFHAGNYADVIKHIVLVEILLHLGKKDKPFEYLDSHAGAGLYHFGTAQAQKLKEHAGGIDKLREEDFPELSDYFSAIRAVNKAGERTVYPGSPVIAQHFLRSQDRAWLFELHPKDFEKLRGNVVTSRKVRVANEDGLKGVEAILPPTSRRAVVLIDPSYEVKKEYEQVFRTIEEGYRKFPTGTYALWYPVVNRQTIHTLERKFQARGIKNVQRYELGLRPDAREDGMTSSGMFVVNPPWHLHEKMQKLLPKLVATLAEPGAGSFKCDIICPE